jgi:class 3 adenylate cyclase
LKTANLAIVFTDIQGFTERTSRQTLEENQRLLLVHHQLLAPLFKAFGGRIVKSIGDAFLVTFESPTQAVLCGMAIQDRLWQHNRTAPESERLDVRVAINVGEVRVEPNDVFGEPVNIASRVEALTAAGEVYFTEAVYLAMNKAEVPSQEVGVFELKGIPGKIRVFHVPRAPYRVEAPSSAPAEAPAPAPEQPPFGNLALSRVSEAALAPGAGLATTAASLGQRAASIGSRLVERTTTVFSGVAARHALPLPSRGVALGVGALALVLALGIVVFRDSPEERAIEAVANATSDKEKAEAVEKARQLIAGVEEPAERSWLSGRLDEAAGAPHRAINDYRAAARAGHDDAGERLAELLGHEECRVRASAAEALGELKLEPARGALKKLADTGGPDESSVPLLGCNSKRAAQKALERLGQ